MRNKSFHIHLHLDHPERENPWLEEPEPDPAAAPFLDEADRAVHACWGPLSAAERRGPDGALVGFADLYARCGFDAAPSVLERLARRAPAAYAAVRAAAAGRRGALATAYPSLILPLAAAADRRAAVRWGLAGFRGRFGRPAEGFVPPAGAADDATLELLAREGLRFVLLPAAAAGAVLEPGGAWRETAPETLDASRPYLWRSPADPSLRLAVFFAPALEPGSLLRRPAAAPSRPVAAPDEPSWAGERLAAKLVDSLRVNDSAELAHAAVDAAWFGLRAARGERALACALDALEREAPADGSCYAEFLDRFPPPQEVRLKAGASRACAHALARWAGDCPCRAPGAAEEPADWRAPLRLALESLSAALAAEAGAARAALARDADAAVDRSGALAFEPSEAAQQAYLDAVSLRHPRPEEALKLLRLAELDRWRLKSLSLWAYEDAGPSAPGALQALRCAARALDLCALAGGKAAADAHEERFVAALSAAPARGTPFANAAAVYRRLAAPERSGAERAAAHAAAADHLAEERGELRPGGTGVWEVVVSPVLRRLRREGRGWSALTMARVSVRHRRTLEAFAGWSAALSRPAAGLEVRIAAAAPDAGRLEAAFLAGEGDALRAALDGAFGTASWSLDALFPSLRRPAARELAGRGGEDRRARTEALARLARRARAPEPAEAAAALAALGDDLPADELPGAREAREAAGLAARRFAEAPGAATLEPLVGLLEAAEKARLHLPLWELRDLAWRGLSAAGPAGAASRRLAALLGLPGGGDDGHQTA